MPDMNTTPVIPLGSARDRGRRLARAMEARRRLHEHRDRVRGGRAWLNGIELGEARPALAHLEQRHD